MKVYIDTDRCPYCQKNFTWKYIDDGHRPWMKGRHTTIYSVIEDKTIALCTLIRDYKANKLYFRTRCTHCHALVSFQRNEDITKELNS